MKANYLVLYKTDEIILIKDECLIYNTMSITNDAENVVYDVHKRFNLVGKILYYVDTDGMVDILDHDGNGVFTGFQFGFANMAEFNKAYSLDVPYWSWEYERI